MWKKGGNEGEKIDPLRWLSRCSLYTWRPVICTAKRGYNFIKCLPKHCRGIAKHCRVAPASLQARYFALPPPLCTEPGLSSLGSAARLRMTQGSAESRGWRTSRYLLRGTFGTFGTRHQAPSAQRVPSAHQAPSAPFLRPLPARDKNCEPNLAWLGDAHDVPPWLRRGSELDRTRSSSAGRDPAQALLRPSPRTHCGTEGDSGTTFGHAVPSAALHLGPALAYP